MSDDVKSFKQVKQKFKEELHKVEPDLTDLNKTETKDKCVESQSNEVLSSSQIPTGRVFPIIQPGEADEEVEIVLIENNDRLSTKTLSMRDAFQEFSKVFTVAMNQKSVNSIAADTFGFLSMLDYTPVGMKKETYDFCNKVFYVQKNSSRESMVYDLVAKAARDCVSDTFTFPFITPVDIDIVVVPRQIEKGLETAQTKTITIETLTFTKDELKYMTFNFIKSVALAYKTSSGNKYKDAVIKFVVDREVLQVDPFSKSSKES